MELDTLFKVAGLTIAVIVLLFGNNIIQQATGYSAFELFRKGAISFSEIFKRRLSNSSTTSPTIVDSSVIVNYVNSLGVVDVFLPPLTRNLISAKLHKRATLKTDTYIEAVFENVNQQRFAAGMKEYYSYPQRYRIIGRPQFREFGARREYVVDLAELEFQYSALLLEETVDIKAKDYIRRKIESVSTSLPSQFQSAHPYFNTNNLCVLGVQMVLITSDNFVLLRRRGKHVMEYVDSWDVSFSGYCGKRVFEDDLFDIGNTVEFELDQEIKMLRGDPREIYFTGMHINKVSGTTVMLGFWNVEATRNELKSFLYRNPKAISQNEPLVFDTTILPKEKYVWDYKNIIVEFEGPVISKALQVSETSLTNRPYMLVPAARASLLLALNAHKKSTDGLVV